ncbi:RagB/SusD family nutrient uptake outer membrane protein [Terrimonas sp. NA20]|uniref:RagB/SusD family nutrient uptake outer membrane protein n=1 Tax=Terrimonas ginsenosidimutans TaxID=2908004 RepID=A0ABS9KRA6_9BACT|nr:RagB/SusD family nutrient uptake outer membrane protein [Terrimonas ginsenosidimutans]MCG2614856.1 RagB/SusD family nutrient uptake outer membrane protein [Terrimonas ginsenosidimutans]
MKRLNINKVAVVALGSILALSSCKIDRSSLNGPSTGTFPANAKEAEMGLFGAYQSVSAIDAASTPMWHVMDNITDIGFARPGTNYTSPITSAITTDNALTTKPWQVHYRTIARCHTVLDNLEKLKSTMTEAAYGQLDGELRFVRAYCYSQMIELYGDVPLLKSAVDLNNANVARTPKNEIEKFLIDELTAIAEKLPVSQPQAGHVRASRVAAYMLKARVALYAKQFTVAAQAANTALTLSNGVFDLTPFNNSVNFVGKDHTVGEPDVSNIFGHAGFKTGKEWIWVAEYNMTIPGNTHNQQYYSASRLGKGVCYWGPTQDLINTFQAKDGLPITESPLYNSAKPYENRDPRLDMYCVRPGSRYMGYQFEPTTTVTQAKNYWPVLNGTSTTPSNVANADATNAFRSFSGYLWRKPVDIADFNSTSVSGVSDLNVGIFRLAELLLLYAEAKIEANDIDNTVYTAINRVRRRALMPDLPTGLSQAQLRKALRYERKVELANDGLRWYDLRRWGIANTVMNGSLYLNRDAKPWTSAVLTGFDDSYTPIYNRTEALKYFTTQDVVYRPNKDEYWPVPKSEMDANNKLVQNPGY